MTETKAIICKHQQDTKTESSSQILNGLRKELRRLLNRQKKSKALEIELIKRTKILTELQGQLDGKTTEANKLIQLSKEVSNKFIMQ